MKTEYWLLLILFGLFNNCFAQHYISYHNLVNEAEYWMYKQEYKKAEKLYNKAFHLEKAFPKDSYLLAKCYAAQGKKKLCYKWLKESSRTPISFTPYFIKRADQKDVFINVFDEIGELEAVSSELKILKKDTDKVYKDSVYTMIRDTMVALSKQDQLYRKNATQEELKSELYLNLLNQNDLSIQKSFLEIIKAYGYPDYHNMGTDKGDLLLVHILGDEQMHRTYKELLYKELQKGNMLPFPYAYMMDRWHLVTNNICYLSMRIYTQKLCTENDYEDIVNRRSDIGLSIYFTGPRKKPFESYNLHPWVNDEFVKKHSLLNKKCK